MNGAGATEPFIEDLVGGIGDRKDARARLREALRSFDEAPIFTIHSFCQRMLSENAFESGSPFDTELLPDERELQGGDRPRFLAPALWRSAPRIRSLRPRPLQGPGLVFSNCCARRR